MNPVCDRFRCEIPDDDDRVCTDYQRSVNSRVTTVERHLIEGAGTGVDRVYTAPQSPNTLPAGPIVSIEGAQQRRLEPFCARVVSNPPA